MIILREKKTKRLLDTATALLEQEIDTLSKKKKTVTIGVTGGSVNKIYETLSKTNNNWNNIEIFLLDERVTTFNSMRNLPKVRKYFSKLISPAKIHEIPVQGNPLLIADKYYELLKRKNAKGFDIIILSAGSGGHIASVFPKKNYKKKGYLLVEDSPKKPSQRITATKSLMKTAKVCFTFFLGDKKKEILKEFQEGNLSETEFPVKFVKKIKKSYVFTDIK